MGFTKNIAVIRGLKSGFSADGGQLSGIIKAEKYGSSLKVEASLINFAPLTEGRYVVGISDGRHTRILDGLGFEGASDVDTGTGFAALICFVNNGSVSPIASAVCGNFHSAAIGIKEEIEKLEQSGVQAAACQVTEYEDEALAQENYYEFEQTDKDSGTLREDKEEEKDGQDVRENAANCGSVEEGAGGLARGECFYARMSGEIQKVLSEYPEEAALCEVVENSKWVRITYGDGKFYVFGVIYEGDNPQYLCYGVPSADSSRPPESLVGMASYIPARDGGYWVMYQDAATGASVKLTVS